MVLLMKAGSASKVDLVLITYTINIGSQSRWSGVVMLQKKGSTWTLVIGQNFFVRLLGKRHLI